MRYFTVVTRILAAVALIAFAGCAAAQQAYPSKPLRIFTPNPPGGGTDILARLIGSKLTDSWGQQVIVDNRGGGNGFIGGKALAGSSPDGHSIMVMSTTHILTPLLLKAPYDPIKDFSAVTTIASSEFVLVLHPSVPANNLPELIAFAKSRPGQLNHASTGGGSPGRLAIELFNIMTEVKIQNIPYKGGGPALVDLLGGQVEMFINNPVTLIPYINSGKIKAIAISGEARSTALRQVPTFTEAGLPGFDVRFWYALLAPASTPERIIDKLAAEIRRILTTPDFRENLVKQALDPFVSTPAQFAALMKADTAKYAKIIKTANIRIEN